MKPGEFLEAILEKKRKRIAGRVFPHVENPPAPPDGRRPFSEALRRNGMSLIAEIKKASPSKGLICADFDPARTAGVYARAGADALSVLTEEDFFLGSLDVLKTVRARTTLPILRKDFIVDRRELLETRAAGADAVLLIVAVLGARTGEFLAAAAALGLETLTEVHDVTELEIALRAGASVIGVNSRNLKTFEVSLETALAVKKALPPDVLAVAESGIRTRADVERLAAAGFDAILVGESLMRSDDPVKTADTLMGRR